MPASQPRHDPSPPDLPDEIEPITLSPEDALDETTWSEVSLTGTRLNNLNVRSFLLSQAIISKVSFEESRLPYFHASDARFDDCNLSNVKTANGAFRRVVFSRSKLTGLQTKETTFSDVVFTDCRMEFAYFDQAKFKYVTFHDCHLRDVEFAETTFENVRFIECELDRSTFDRTRFDRSEFRRCTMTGLRGLKQLKGAGMELNDIIGLSRQLAAELGIRILTERDARPR